MMRLFIKGASHAPEITFTLAGFPPDFSVDKKVLAAFMARRAPGRDPLSTQRREPDKVQFSQYDQFVFGRIANTDVRPADYGAKRTIPRPGHADFGQWIELGRIPTGGGKNSGRLTAALCAVGGMCKQFLEARGIAIEAEIARIGGETNPKRFDAAILKAQKNLDSVGGTIRCQVRGVPAGLGGALFDGLESALSSALFAIPGVKGVAFGNGFDAASLRGSENNDAFVVTDGIVRTRTNRHGGILGGRTTGMPIEFTLAMKPTPTIYREQQSVDLATGKAAKLAMKGRHDPCIVRRAVPVVEAMAAYVLMDKLLADEAGHPRICLTLTGATLKEDLAQYAAQRYFTDMLELRVDLLEKPEREKVATFLKKVNVPVILTFRRHRDGGAFTGSEATRKAFFKRILALRGVRGVAPYQLYVDFESDFKVPALVKLANGKGVRIIRSLHDFKGKPRDIVKQLHKLVGRVAPRPPFIPKIAFTPRNLSDVSAVFHELCTFRDFPFVVCAMGPLGLATRVLASRLGSVWTYTSVGGLNSLGHISPHELVRTYRYRTLNDNTRLFGVTGWPLAFTRSPELNNLAWGDADEDAVMVPLPAKTAKDAVDFFQELYLRGMAVTIPHKQTIMPLLDRIDSTAKAIGAVNTVVREGVQLVGYNTDESGFAEAITRFLGRDNLSGLNVAVLGAGGASKAVAHALKRLKAKFKVFHRETPPQGYDLIVNATPVDPIPDYAFAGREAVYDLVYVPEVTPLMARAKRAGCRVENGLSMLVAQARAQRELWSCALG